MSALFTNRENCLPIFNRLDFRDETQPACPSFQAYPGLYGKILIKLGLLLWL